MCSVAVINVHDRDDFINKVIKSLPPKAYMAVTDEATYVWLAPKVTSRHRHYYKLDLVDEEDWKEVRKALVDAGIEIVRGHLSFPPGV